MTAPLDLRLDLTAVVVAVTGGEPRVLTVRGADGRFGLPTGPLTAGHRTLELGLRAWVQTRTGLALDYVEQLYTFGDRERGFAERADETGRVLSIGYLALVREAPLAAGTEWRDWYDFLPWEDHRAARPPIGARLHAALLQWAATGPRTVQQARRERVLVGFGDPATAAWNEDRVLERFELLYEAGLVTEAAADAAESGEAMAGDHRRMLATAMARLRGKLKYRPVVFELLPETFTFLELQRTVEALAGLRLHKPNFRRLVEQQGLVEETGGLRTETGGRPARLYRFRREVLRERPAPGLRLPRASGGSGGP